MSALTFATAHLLRVVPRARVGRAVGRLADRRWSEPVGRAVVRLYSRMYDVSFDECEEKEGWSSFDHFFTRRLRDGVRPIASGRVVASPADGRIESMGRIDAGSTFEVKGRPYRVDELLGDADEAKRYAGGAGCVVYLSPRDYHRVHAPVEGTISLVRSIPGDYYPVNAIGMRHVANLFARNRRVAIHIDTPPELGMGRVAVVMVVAMIVGRITVTGIDAHDVPLGDQRFDPPRRVARGDEIGVFHLGSTAVVLLEKRAAGKWLVGEGPVQFGQALCAAPETNGAGNGKSGNGARR